MYHLRDVTLSFTMRKYIIYECPFSIVPPSGGVGEGFLLTLHHNTLAPRKLHHFVKCFIFPNHFELCSAIFSVTP